MRENESERESMEERESGGESVKDRVRERKRGERVTVRDAAREGEGARKRE